MISYLRTPTVLYSGTANLTTLWCPKTLPGLRACLLTYLLGERDIVYDFLIAATVRRLRRCVTCYEMIGYDKDGIT